MRPPSSCRSPPGSSPFQFTHPVWGATPASRGSLSPSLCFNSRTPCGVRQARELDVARPKDVSIHAPRVGCDNAWADARSDKQWFQFTHPVWGATCSSDKIPTSRLVSIHAPRVGCDLMAPQLSVSVGRFNSRTPCGVRRLVLEALAKLLGVSIHAPRVGCDNLRVYQLHILLAVSIHAPRVGCDCTTAR